MYDMTGDESPNGMPQGGGGFGHPGGFGINI